MTDGRKPLTKNTRYSQLNAFLNFAKNNIEHDFQNPCDSPFLEKMFKAKASTAWEIIEKEVIDEIIFKTNDLRYPRTSFEIDDFKKAVKWVRHDGQFRLDISRISPINQLVDR